MKAAIERRFGEKVFRTAITSSAKIQESEASKRTIFQHDRQSNGARDFMDLGREVLTRLQLQPSSSLSEEHENEPLLHLSHDR
jgi:chromosome partitioning protein